VTIKSEVTENLLMQAVVWQRGKSHDQVLDSDQRKKGFAERSQSSSCQDPCGAESRHLVTEAGHPV